MTVNLKNSAGEVTSAPIGFSWTLLFFGIFVPIFRGDWKWFFLMFLIVCCTFGCAWLVFPFIYNGIYLRGLLKKGFRPADDFSRSTLQAKGFVLD